MSVYAAFLTGGPTTPSGILPAPPASFFLHFFILKILLLSYFPPICILSPAEETATQLDSGVIETGFRA